MQRKMVKYAKTEGIRAENIQIATIYPTRAEAAMMLAFMAILIITLGATLRAANYEPECVPAIVTIKETM